MEDQNTHIVRFSRLSLPKARRLELAFGAVDPEGTVYFSVQPFGQSILQKAIKDARPEAPTPIRLIWYKDHHLVPISWLLTRLPPQQPFFKQIQKKIRKVLQPKKSTRSKPGSSADHANMAKRSNHDPQKNFLTPVSSTKPGNQANFPMAHELGISILTFRNFRIPRSAQTYHPLAYGAIDVQGEVYFSVNPFGVHIFGLAIEQAVAKVPNAPTLIYHKDHHLVPIWWLQINIPRQQPFLKRVRNQILRLVKNQGRIA